MSTNEMRDIRAEILSSGEMTVFTIPPAPSGGTTYAAVARNVRVDGTLPCYGPYPIPGRSTSVERTAGATVRSLTMIIGGSTAAGSGVTRLATVPGEVTAADFAFKQADGTYRRSPLAEAYVDSSNAINARATVHVRFNITAPPAGRPDPAIFLSALERLRHAPSRHGGRRVDDTATARARARSAPREHHESPTESGDMANSADDSAHAK